MQTTYKMQTEFNAKLRCRLTRKTFFCRQKRGNIRNPLAYGTAEASEMIAS